MGHVFVVHGDLMSLACDAWLVPGGNGPGQTWKRALPRERLPRPARWGQPGTPRACLLGEAEPPEPLPFLCDIVSVDDRHDPTWWVDGARDFVRVAARTLVGRGRAPVFGRALPLLALPLVGTGGGGATHLSGELVGLLLGALGEEARAANVDVALVLLEGPAWAAAQHARRAHPVAEAFAALPGHLVTEADALARLARSGDLVLFLGAGMSQAAGLPGWAALLAALGAEKAALEDPEEQRALRALGELDRAAIIQRRLPPGETIGEAAARLIARRARRYGLGHGLLASLPVDEVITTNYDDLFERASSAVGRQCTVLPGGAAARGQRWLLKMHGTIDRPETIIMTREDYMKFQENRGALAGIVQALLLTRHMLFVGFSLSDDNFHRIAHAVRQAVGGQKRFGTTVVVEPNPLARELWSDDLAWIALDRDPGGEAATPARSRAAQARLLEIFLDRLSCEATTGTSHLGDYRYEGALSAGERALRDRLSALAAAASDAERETGAWAEVERLLARLGIHHY